MASFLAKNIRDAWYESRDATRIPDVGRSTSNSSGRGQGLLQQKRLLQQKSAGKEYLRAMQPPKPAHARQFPEVRRCAAWGLGRCVCVRNPWG